MPVSSVNGAAELNRNDREIYLCILGFLQEPGVMGKDTRMNDPAFWEV